MRVTGFVHNEGKRWLIEFPDCLGCQTFAKSEVSLRRVATEAVSGWYEAHLASGQVPPRPKAHSRAPVGKRAWQVWVDPAVALAVELRWARHDAGFTQAELAKLAGVSQQQIAKLERPGENPTIQTVRKVARALGASVEVSIVRSA